MNYSAIARSSQTIRQIVLFLGVIVTLGLFVSSVLAFIKHSSIIGAMILLLITIFTMLITLFYYVRFIE